MAADSLAKSRSNLNVSRNPRTIFRKTTTIDILLCKISIYFVHFVAISCAQGLKANLNSDLASSLS